MVLKFLKLHDVVCTTFLLDRAVVRAACILGYLSIKKNKTTIISVQQSIAQQSSENKWGLKIFNPAKQVFFDILKFSENDLVKLRY